MLHVILSGAIFKIPLCISADESGAWGKVCILDFRASRLFSLSLFITFLRHYSTSSGGFGKGYANRPRWNDRQRQRAGVFGHLQIKLPPFALFVLQMACDPSHGSLLQNLESLPKTVKWNTCVISDRILGWKFQRIFNRVALKFRKEVVLCVCLRPSSVSVLIIFVIECLLIGRIQLLKKNQNEF